MGRYLVGVDVGGTKLAYGLFDEHHQLIARSKEPSRPELPAEEAIDGIVRDIDVLLEKNGLSRTDLAGVGACFPSYINAEDGYIIYSANLPTWKGLHIRDIMSEKLGLPVQIDNDANAAALAEHRMGAGRGHRHMIYITVSTGIGGGIIINNRLFRGSHGMAGEIGHVLVSDSRGEPCGCGNPGCAESISSGTSMAHYATRKIEEGRHSRIADLAKGERIEGRHIAQAAVEKDELALETIENAAEYLGRLLSSMYQALNIDHVVYGGGAMKISSTLIEQAKKRFAQLTKYAPDYPVSFVPAELGDDTGIIGAALLVDDLL